MVVFGDGCAMFWTCVAFKNSKNGTIATNKFKRERERADKKRSEQNNIDGLLQH